MKIERISKIKGYRIFNDFNWTTDLPDFSRFNLIYGWNGSGKTTLSHLFTYLQNNQNISQGDVRFQIDGANVTGASISSSVIPQVKVFNRDTVSRSLFEVANHELAPIFYLGADSADKQKRIEELKIEGEGYKSLKGKSQGDVVNANSNLDSFCKNKASEIKALLTASGGGPYNFYNKSNFSTKCEELLSYGKPAYCLLPETYEKYISAKSGMALDKIDPVSINLPDYLRLVSDVGGLLQRSVVSNVITELMEKPDLAAWIQRGLALHKVDESDIQCRFCTNVIPVERMKALEMHFNDQLTAFQNEIDRKVVIIEQAKNTIKLFSVPSASLLYQHYKDDYEKSIATWSATKSMVSLFLNSLIKALKEKRDQPFKPMNLIEFISTYGTSQEEKTTLGKILSFMAGGAQAISVMLGMSAIQNINKIIDEHNQYSANFNTEVDKSRKILEVHTVSISLSEFEIMKNTIKENEEKLSEINKKLMANEKDILQLEREIKEFVKPVEELNAEMADYLGRDELRFLVKDNGYVISRNGFPALNLSEGERTAIAFMYFLKTLEDTDFDISKGVVVIDDPISSLDANSMYSAFGFMKARMKNVNQLFVLTHSFTFFRHIRKWFFDEPKLPAIQGWQGSKDYRTASRFYMLDTIVNNGNRTASLKMIDPLLKDYESEYQYIFKKIHDFVQSGTTQPLENYYGLPNMARRLLETFLTFKMPHFTANGIVKKLDEVAFDNAKKTRILRFLHVHSHYDQVGEPEHDLSLLSEAPAVIADLIELIKTLDRDHYEGMVSFSDFAVNKLESTEGNPA